MSLECPDLQIFIASFYLLHEDAIYVFKKQSHYE